MVQFSKLYKTFVFTFLCLTVTTNLPAEEHQSKLGLHAETGNITTDLAD